MKFIELQKILQNAKGKKYSRSKIGAIVGTSRQNINVKFNNENSEVTVSELQKVEKECEISLYKSGLNTGERQNDTTVFDRIKNFGKNLSAIQAQNSLLDREMAQLLKISEKQYLGLVSGKDKPTVDILCNIKRNFKVAIDELLFGEWVL